MEKARELLGLGVVKSLSSTSEAAGIGFDSTRQILALPAGVALSLASTAATTAPVKTALSSEGSQQIRNLLAADSRSATPISVKSRASSTSSEPRNSPIVPKSNSLSPGQSLIRKLQVSTASAPSTSVTRQLLVSNTATCQAGNSTTTTISLVLGPARPGMSERPLIPVTSGSSGINLPTTTTIAKKPDSMKTKLASKSPSTSVVNTVSTIVQPSKVAPSSIKDMEAKIDNGQKKVEEFTKTDQGSDKLVKVPNSIPEKQDPSDCGNDPILEDVDDILI